MVRLVHLCLGVDDGTLHPFSHYSYLLQKQGKSAAVLGLIRVHIQSICKLLKQNKKADSIPQDE